MYLTQKLTHEERATGPCFDRDIEHTHREVQALYFRTRECLHALKIQLFVDPATPCGISTFRPSRSQLYSSCNTMQPSHTPDPWCKSPCKTMPCGVNAFKYSSPNLWPHNNALHLSCTDPTCTPHVSTQFPSQDKSSTRPGSKMDTMSVWLKIRHWWGDSSI